MRLVRYGRPGKEKPGLFDDEGRLRDLSGVIADIDGAVLNERALRKLAKVDVKTLPLVRGNPRLGVPVKGVGKFIGIGMNYADHVAETGSAIPTEPVFFTKAISCLNGPDDPIRLPLGSKKTDWEVELGIVIGKRTSYLDSPAQAKEAIAGYLVVNDISERAFQMERSGQWSKGKSAETFCPAGPWLVTPEEISNPLALEMQLDVNQVRRQKGSTSNMVFSPDQIVHHLSQFMVLEPGDLINTGTPPGVGMGFNPPIWLKEGDVMELSITGLGTQRQEVVAAR